MAKNIYDVIIIGSGPAGMAAAIYAQRARLDFVVLEEQYISGGQIINTYDVDNYPGMPNISGMELANRMEEHAKGLGVQVMQDGGDSDRRTPCTVGSGRRAGVFRKRRLLLRHL